MKTKQKKFAYFLCTALALLGVAGCGSDDTASKTADGIIEDAASYLTLADYHSITLSSSEIDAQLQSQIDSALANSVTYERVTEGKVKDGDTVNIYYVGRTTDGVAFDGGSLTEETDPEGYDLTIGSGTFIDGFESGLIGEKIGTTCDVDVTFPENYGAEELAGQDATFTVTINYKQGEAITPEFDDDFVAENLSGYTSAQDYKDQMRSSIIQSMAMDSVRENTTVNEYPKEELSAMENQLKISIEQYLTGYGYTLDEYLDSLGTDEDTYNAQITETAKENTKDQLICNAIAQAEDLDVSDESYQEKLDDYLSAYGYEDEDALNGYFMENYGTTLHREIYSGLLEELVDEYLVGNVTEE